MPLKIVGSGLGRTGTLSLKRALEMLGFLGRMGRLLHVKVGQDAQEGRLYVDTVLVRQPRKFLEFGQTRCHGPVLHAPYKP